MTLPQVRFFFISLTRIQEQKSKGTKPTWGQRILWGKIKRNIIIDLMEENHF